MRPNETREQAHARAALSDPHHRRPILTEADLVKIEKPGSPLGYAIVRRSWLKKGDKILAEGSEPDPAVKPGFSIEAIGLNAGALKALETRGLTTAEGILEAAAENGEWYEDVAGIGRTSATRLVEAAREHLEG